MGITMHVEAINTKHFSNGHTKKAFRSQQGYLIT